MLQLKSWFCKTNILSKIGYENLKVSGTELNKEKYIKIDLNSIAKGYAVDKIALLWRTLSK